MIRRIMAEKNNIEKLKKEIRQLVSKISEVPENQLKDEALFVEDLGMDSMMALEVVASIEKKYKIVVPEEAIPTLRSLKEVYNFMEKFPIK
jgi:acyl carrier protein